MSGDARESLLLLLAFRVLRGELTEAEAIEIVRRADRRPDDEAGSSDA